jgi:hypothetical protein
VVFFHMPINRMVIMSSVHTIVSCDGVTAIATSLCASPSHNPTGKFGAL